jgi:hypothetical protein
MNRFRGATFCLTLLAVAIPSWAKGDMVLLEIMGGDLPFTIKISDPKIGDFNIWAGPGTSRMINGVTLESAEGFIIPAWTATSTKLSIDFLPHRGLDDVCMFTRVHCAAMFDFPGIDGVGKQPA